MGIFLSVCTCWFHNTFTLLPWLVSADFGTCSYKCFLSSYTPVSLHTLKCSCAHTLSCLFMYCSFASTGHAYIMWSIVSSNCWQSLYYYYYYYSTMDKVPKWLCVSIKNTAVTTYTTGTQGTYDSPFLKHCFRGTWSYYWLNLVVVYINIPVTCGVRSLLCN